MSKQDQIITHIDALIELAGLDKSEAGTVTFIELLDEAVINARKEITGSHRDGLGLDCRWIIAETLLKWNPNNLHDERLGTL